MAPCTRRRLQSEAALPHSRRRHRASRPSWTRHAAAPLNRARRATCVSGPEAPNPRLPDAWDACRVVLAEPERLVADGPQALGDLDFVAAASRFIAIERVHLAAGLAEVLPPVADWSVPSSEAELNELDSAGWTELTGRARPPGREETFTERLRSDRRYPVRPRHTQTLCAPGAARYRIGRKQVAPSAATHCCFAREAEATDEDVAASACRPFR